MTITAAMAKEHHDTAYITDTSPLRRAFLYIPPIPLI
nr:MAG TPA: hypothetical protein [Caudoviricetes sp.]